MKHFAENLSRLLTSLAGTTNDEILRVEKEVEQRKTTKITYEARSRDARWGKRVKWRSRRAANGLSSSINHLAQSSNKKIKSLKSNFDDTETTRLISSCCERCRIIRRRKRRCGFSCVPWQYHYRDFIFTPIVIKGKTRRWKNFLLKVSQRRVSLWLDDHFAFYSKLNIQQKLHWPTVSLARLNIAHFTQQTHHVRVCVWVFMKNSSFFSLSFHKMLFMLHLNIHITHQ